MLKNLANLITFLKPKSPISEAFRTLRTNIQFSSFDKDLKMIAVTSTMPGEGKSTVLSNLAITMVQAGQKVIIIDCDLRKPKVHKLFQMSNNVGFTNILVENIDYKNVLKNHNKIEKLDVITSGPIPPNPSELLASNKGRELFAKIKEDYDVVLIDAPPVGVVTDAAVLSTIVDGIILVAGFGQVEGAAIKHSKELLDKVNANIIGVVINKIPMSNKKHSGKYYYYNYYNYYGNDTDNTKE